MATVHRGWQRDDAPPEVRAERARKATIATMLRTARGTRTMREVEEATQVPTSNMSLMERGRAYPSAPTLKRLCAYYGLSFDVAAAMIVTEKASIASQVRTPDRYQAMAREAQTRSAAAVTAFINAGPNFWLDERQAWLDAVIAEETKNGGSAFGGRR